MNSSAVITNEEYLWQTTLVALESRFTKPIFETWIKPMRVLGLSTDEITLSVQNQFAKDWAENRFKGTISAALA
jgi:chromosomal replication initiator protein